MNTIMNRSVQTTVSVLSALGTLIVLTITGPISAQLAGPFSEPQSLYSFASTEEPTEKDPHVATDGNGVWIAVWESTLDLYGGIGTDYDILMSRSVDNAETWSSPIPLSVDDGGRDGTPRLATDGMGNWMAVWWSGDDLAGTVGTDNDIFVARSTDNGVSWTAAVALNANADTDSNNDYYPRIASNGGSHWVTVWMTFERDIGAGLGVDSDLLVSHSCDKGVTWSYPIPLNNDAETDTAEDYFPVIATDGAGTWLTVFESFDSLGVELGTDKDIKVARSIDNGATWTDPIPLNTHATTDSAVDERADLATDGMGNWAAAWYSEENIAGLIGDDRDILVSHSSDDGATWSDPIGLDADDGEEINSEAPPSIAFDDLGNLMTVWAHFDTIGGHIQAARSEDGGASWSESTVLSSEPVLTLESETQIAVDPMGNCVVLWSSRNVGVGESRIKLTHFAVPDCNANLMSDRQETTDGSAADCNGNLLPDECEPDTDLDGLIDDCESTPLGDELSESSGADDEDPEVLEAQPAADTSSAADNESTGSLEASGAGQAEPSSDCGTGLCGGGIGFITPLLLMGFVRFRSCHCVLVQRELENGLV